MATRSLNKVMLIGNLTRDPELRYTPAGTAVCTFGLATNRYWTKQSGETKEDTQFHRIVAWNKLGELCAQLLAKGRKVYVEGRLSTHVWTGQDGVQRSTTEIVIEDMIILDSKRFTKEEIPPVGTEEPPTEIPENVDINQSQAQGAPIQEGKKSAKKDKKDKKIEEENPKEDNINEEITPDDIPF